MRHLLPALVTVALLADLAAAQTQLHEFRGVHDLDGFGHGLATVGDCDGDGFADLLVGTRDNQAPHANAAWVLSGQTGGLLHIWNEGASFDGFGFAVGGAGDCDGDGFPEVIIGAPLTTAGAGMAYVFSTRTHMLLHLLIGAQLGDEFGGKVGGAGDVDQDGRGDLIVGAYYADVNGGESGSVYVYSGASAALLYVFHGDASGDLLGSSVASAGDVDGDGVADLIAGARGDDNTAAEAGSARVWSGRTGAVLFTFDGEAAGDHFGHAVAAAGDVDLDGYGDLLVGAPHNDVNGADAGAAYLYSGQSGALLRVLRGHAAGIWFGAAVDGTGDTDGDAVPDLAVGAPLDDTGAVPSEEAGSARVFSGASGLELVQVFGTAGMRLGFSVAGVGDVNGDGRADLASGSLVMSSAADLRGLARVDSVASCAPCFPTGQSLCFGNGLVASCPCGNESAPGAGAGCLNSSGAGAALSGSGAASLAADTLVLSAQGLPSGVPGILVQGTTVPALGAGVATGDGLICVGGTLARLGVTFADGGGSALFPAVGGTPISQLGGVLAGQTRVYALWHRDPAAYCTAATFNFSNAVRLTWQP